MFWRFKGRCLNMMCIVILNYGLRIRSDSIWLWCIARKACKAIFQLSMINYKSQPISMIKSIPQNQSILYYHKTIYIQYINIISLKSTYIITNIHSINPLSRPSKQLKHIVKMDSSYSCRSKWLASIIQCSILTQTYATRSILNCQSNLSKRWSDVVEEGRKSYISLQYLIIIRKIFTK